MSSFLDKFNYQAIASFQAEFVSLDCTLADKYASIRKFDCQTN
ncbi:MAG: hypothetical protein V7L17_14110 [Nostoc sp.]